MVRIDRFIGKLKGEIDDTTPSGKRYTWLILSGAPGTSRTL